MQRITGTHPYCELFPPMDSKQFATLVDSLRERGAVEPIKIVVDEDGKILDGRHRKAAIDKVDQRITYTVETFKGDDAAKLAFVVARNLARRHLTTRQRAAIAAELAGLTPGRPSKNASGEAAAADDAPEPPEPTMRQREAAEALNVSRSSVQRATKMKHEDPEAFEDAKAGRKPPARSKPSKSQTAASSQEAPATNTADTPSATPSELAPSATEDRYALEAPATINPVTATVKVPAGELVKLKKKYFDAWAILESDYSDEAFQLWLAAGKRNGWTIHQE